MHSTVRSKHPGLPWLFSSSLSGSKYPHLSGIEMAPGPWADGTGRLLNQLLQNIRLCNHSQSPIFVEMQGFKIYNIKRRSACSVTQSCPTFWNPMVSKQSLLPARLLCPGDFPGKNTGMGCHFLLQGIFPIQGSNPLLLCHLHCRQILYHWDTRKSPKEGLCCCKVHPILLWTGIDTGKEGALWLLLVPCESCSTFSKLESSWDDHRS